MIFLKFSLTISNILPEDRVFQFRSISKNQPKNIHIIYILLAENILYIYM